MWGNWSDGSQCLSQCEARWKVFVKVPISCQSVSDLSWNILMLCINPLSGFFQKDYKTSAGTGKTFRRYGKSDFDAKYTSGGSNEMVNWARTLTGCQKNWKVQFLNSRKRITAAERHRAERQAGKDEK